MAYDFYVIDGKRLVDYKPTKEHYGRAFVRFGKKISENEIGFEDNKDKILYILIKMIGKETRNMKSQDSRKTLILSTLRKVWARATPWILFWSWDIQNLQLHRQNIFIFYQNVDMPN